MSAGFFLGLDTTRSSTTLTFASLIGVFNRSACQLCHPASSQKLHLPKSPFKRAHGSKPPSTIHQNAYSNALLYALFGGFYTLFFEGEHGFVEFLGSGFCILGSELLGGGVVDFGEKVFQGYLSFDGLTFI